jgi:hypothetical protein
MRKPELDAAIDELGLFPAIQEYRVAAALFTYQCTITCKHCMFGCRSGRANAGAVMTPTQCVDALEMLHDTGRLVHIAGGEVMLYWDVLAESVKLAHERGLAPHFIETNCSFATDDTIARDRLTFLRDHGVGGIYTSCDPYHQEHVPAEDFLRVRRIATELFGEKRFYSPDATDDRVREYVQIVRDESRLREYVREYTLMMVGTGQQQLSKYLDTFPVETLAEGCSCNGNFTKDTLWEIHIDVYGNIFMNCGIILGNVASTTPAEVLDAGPEHTNRFVEALCEGGPMALAKIAEAEYGFVPPTEVCQSCELCYLTRKHLHPFHPDIFGPDEVYA